MDIFIIQFVELIAQERRERGEDYGRIVISPTFFSNFKKGDAHFLP